MKKKLTTTILAVAALSLALTGCSETVEDRDSGAGKQADSYENATNVVVYKNADNVPNVAHFCLGDYGWASTLSNTSTGKSIPSALVRFPEYDVVCTGIEEAR